MDADHLGKQNAERVLQLTHRLMDPFQPGWGRKALLERHDPTVIDNQDVANRKVAGIELP